MEVELQLGVVAPREAAPVEDRPEEGEREGGQQEEAGEDYDEGVLQPAAATPLVVLLVVPVSGRMGKWKNEKSIEGLLKKTRRWWKTVRCSREILL